MRRTNTDVVLRIVVTMLLGAVLVAGCGGNKGKKGDGDAEPGGDIVVEGRVSLRGSTPFTLLLLEGKNGTNYMVESSRVVEELKRLEGMDITVTAKVLPQIEGEAPALSIRSYNLLPFPTGERPIIGVIQSYPPDLVYLYASDDVTWSIKGDFQSVFLGYGGAKVWVVGDRMQPSVAMDRNVKEIYVTQYGVIKE
jgi:hypothetical protein